MALRVSTYERVAMHLYVGYIAGGRGWGMIGIVFLVLIKINDFIPNPSSFYLCQEF
jgi:hypothetical protein